MGKTRARIEKLVDELNGLFAERVRRGRGPLPMYMCDACNRIVYTALYKFRGEFVCRDCRHGRK